MGTVEEYMAARTKCLEFADQIRDFQRMMQIFLMGLRYPPRGSSTLPSSWLSREKMCQLLDDAAVAWSVTQQIYEQLTPDTRQNLAPPLAKFGHDFPLNLGPPSESQAAIERRVRGYPF
ncbi:MAG: hypothetical protein JO261_09125 [Alphaproteobacteria bacterium]|nr:hypothetical protein [Alphaproteobacteria bacterium]MBV9693851.1 hypothetical protein [Alphaproteobacteria bacterium]